MERRRPTDEQIKAVASPLRLRILRLCHDRDWTNKELAERFEKDPSTMLHHLRLLEKAGFIEATEPRQGPSGAYEKPYRSTGLTWELSFELPPEGEPVMLTAFREELAEAGNDSVEEMTRFFLHLAEDDRAEFVGRFMRLIEEYKAGDAKRREAGAPAMGGMFVLHRLATDSRTD